ncbi:hypothetical protein UB33_05965 [Photobacterium angustum]|uniref:hypothetical protein n=1 Tax=Photobacterium angustum TaxID=661 RepID=UPI0005E4DFF3|nr:hypothetical protein [Photobacterium angustum]KJF92741.1 hypothetical protein UB39_19030 [Photobacterium angustum]KJG07219.1 hypothetical protein UB33_05965 [Photobacterium angustum]PSV87706.1 hypothetical protein CTN01_21960 [Photobacterium angustum]PSW83146.1 hypothetical protein CTN03_01525 [Photobacterium angustum]
MIETPLLITASIDVFSPHTAICDKEERLNQYISALKEIFSQKVFLNIVFCENTGYSKQEFLNKVDVPEYVNFEYISFNGDKNCVLIFGKGYGEGEIIKYSLNQSELLNHYEYFFKLTGRLYVRNISMFLRKETKTFFFRPPSLEQNKIDTRFYCVSKNFYLNNLLNAYLDVNDDKGYFLEHAFNDKLSKIRKNSFSFFYPDIIGLSGSTGNVYTLSLARKLKLLIKSFCKHSLVRIEK